MNTFQGYRTNCFYEQLLLSSIGQVIYSIGRSQLCKMFMNMLDLWQKGGWNLHRAFLLIFSWRDSFWLAYKNWPLESGFSSFFFLFFFFGGGGGGLSPIKFESFYYHRGIFVLCHLKLSTSNIFCVSQDTEKVAHIKYIFEFTTIVKCNCKFTVTLYKSALNQSLYISLY